MALKPPEAVIRWASESGAVQGDLNYWLNLPEDDPQWDHYVSTIRAPLIDEVFTNRGGSGSREYWDTASIDEISDLYNEFTDVSNDPATLEGQRLAAEEAERQRIAAEQAEADRGAAAEAARIAAEAAAAETTRLDFLRSVKLLMPYLPTDLTQVYIDAWATHSGNAELAMAEVIADERFDLHFAGLKRDDGTLRMTIPEYLGTWATYEDRLLEAVVNPALFQSQLAELIAGDVSGNEFRSRVDAIEERILAQETGGALGGLMESYATFYGVALTREAIIASALDPTVGEAIIERRISIAEIGGEAAIRGFLVTRNTAEGLWQTGFGQQQASQLFAGAADMLPSLSRASQRQSEGLFNLDSFIEAQAYQNPAENRRVRRILEGEASGFSSDKADVARSQSGALTGLRPR